MNLARSNHPHRRHNPLTNSWVLVSPQRTKRPWQGAVEETAEIKPPYDPGCYLCAGNVRSNGEHNPDYRGTYVFDNDFPALLDFPDSDKAEHAIAQESSGLLKSEAVNGCCRVICYHPKHNRHIAQMSQDEIIRIIDCWTDQYKLLGKRYSWVQIFENRGAAMGCSNPHPHGQIWATDSLPSEAADELDTQKAYYRQHGRPLLLDYVETEIEQSERLVLENDSWLVVVPYWATWPFETLLLPRTCLTSFDQLNQQQRVDLALIWHQLVGTYDSVFDTEFPYSMGWHSAPQQYANEGWQLHAHFYPPLLRSATIKKFMVGYELLSEPQRDITAEASAHLLRQAANKFMLA